MCLCKFGQNLLTSSDDNAGKQSYIDACKDADGINSKTNIPPLRLGVGGLKVNLLINVYLKSVHMIYLLKCLLMEYNIL